MTELVDQFIALPASTHLLIGGILVIHFVIAPRLGMVAFSMFSLPGTAVHELILTSKFAFDMIGK